MDKFPFLSITSNLMYQRYTGLQQRQRLAEVAISRLALLLFLHDEYRCSWNIQGVFINPALVEPFGLTLIEVGFPPNTVFSFVIFVLLELMIQFMY